MAIQIPNYQPTHQVDGQTISGIADFPAKRGNFVTFKDAAGAAGSTPGELELADGTTGYALIRDVVPGGDLKDVDIVDATFGGPPGWSNKPVRLVKAPTVLEQVREFERQCLSGEGERGRTK